MKIWKTAVIGSVLALSFTIQPVFSDRKSDDITMLLDAGYSASQIKKYLKNNKDMYEQIEKLTKQVQLLEARLSNVEYFSSSAIGMIVDTMPKGLEKRLVAEDNENFFQANKSLGKVFNPVNPYITLKDINQ